MDRKSPDHPWLTTDREGHPWKAYPNGRERYPMLCAAHRPYHFAYDADGNETEGKCDGVNRKGITIATFTL